MVTAIYKGIFKEMNQGQVAPIDVGSTFELYHNVMGDLLKGVKEEYLSNEKNKPNPC